MAKIDATMLAKAKFEMVKDKEKLEKYNILPTKENPVTPEMIAEAATLRAEEYDKDIKGYVKELEIAVKRFTEHTERDLVESNYKRLESYDLAVEAAEEDDPFAAIVA